jgi:Flp pilus assembly protein TadG
VRTDPPPERLVPARRIGGADERGPGGPGGLRGSAAVEFALVLPLLLVLALTILEVALLTKDQLIVQGAARAGAREAAVTTDDASAQRSALDAAVGLTGARLDVLVRRDGGVGGPVTVTVTYHASIAVTLVAWLFPDRVDLSASATMRQETG